MADAPYQSLYRRFRPQRFDEVLGQDHIVNTLRNALRSGTTVHAYLFSGPRGTGKTSTARILAKALNCEALVDGEPCGVCEPCVSIEKGTSFYVSELDAASNNSVEQMRDLIARAAMGSPGKKKVYIVDEVHMLSKGAENALLKTLEEPPDHVVFVLATTDPHKMLPTIRSRTQHYEFRLLPADVLSGLIRQVNENAGLGLADDALDSATRKGRGSARDALSVLDQVAAAGGAVEEHAFVESIVDAVADGDVESVLTAIAGALQSGSDARSLAEDLITQLREAFLSAMSPSLMSLAAAEAERAADQGRRLGPAGMTNALDLIGQSMADMRESLDPRVALEVALVRACRPDTDPRPAALLERIEKLERRLTAEAAAPEIAAAHRATSAEDSPPAQAAPARPSASGPASARAALGAVRKKQETSPPPRPPQSRPTAPPPTESGPPSTESGPPGASMPSRDELTKVWGDEILDVLPRKAKVRYEPGRFLSVEGDTAVFALPNPIHRDRCEEVRGEVEAALSQRFGTRVRLKLEVDPSVGAPPDSSGPGATEADSVDEPIPSAHELDDAPAEDAMPDKLKKLFPGAEEVE